MELDLRRLYDVTVVGIRAGDARSPRPAERTGWKRGIRAYLFADAEKLGKAAALFSAEAAGADR